MANQWETIFEGETTVEVIANAGAATLLGPDGLTGPLFEPGDTIRWTVNGVTYQQVAVDTSDGYWTVDRTVGNVYLTRVLSSSSPPADDGTDYAIRTGNGAGITAYKYYLVLYARTSGTYTVKIERLTTEENGEGENPMKKFVDLAGVARIAANLKAYFEKLTANKAESDLSNVDAKHFRSLADQTNIVTTTGTGVVYRADVPGITALTAGVSFVMIPHTPSTTKTPTLNVNNLGAKYIRQPLTSNTGATAPGALDTWLTQGHPVKVTYNGSQWEIDIPRPSAAYLYGYVPVANGGTGAANAPEALANLGAVAKTAITVDAIGGDKSFVLTADKSNSERRYVYATGITSLKLASSGTFDSAAEAYYSVVFLSGSTATTITNTLGAYFTGDDCTAGVFTPVANKTYEVDIWWNGLSWQAAVRGSALA